MEAVLQKINKNFVSLSPEDAQESEEIVNVMMEIILRKMKTANSLFEALFREVYCGGSFCDRLKIGRPEEFDYDLLLTLPKKTRPVLNTSDIPGFVTLQLLNLDGFMAQPEVQSTYKELYTLVDDNDYLLNEAVLNWMYDILEDILPLRLRTYEVEFRMGGPALTLHIVGGGREIKVDLVASFVFGQEMWPKKGFRRNPVPSKPEFCIVPKRPKFPKDPTVLRYWRLSFQEQERAMIRDKMCLKPTIRLLKKLRDTLGHDCIVSYYIKTIGLHLVDREDDSFWKKSLSSVFLTVLEEYRMFIAKKTIPYFWNTEENLIEGVNQNTLEAINDKLIEMINEIKEHCVDKPEIIAQYLLTGSEYVAMFCGSTTHNSESRRKDEEHIDLSEIILRKKNRESFCVRHFFAIFCFTLFCVGYIFYSISEVRSY